MEEPQGPELREERDELRESLGRIGAWSFALETLTAAEERDAVAEIESFGYRAIWLPESVESREVFAHASWILASTERVLAVSGIANIWARDPTAMANGWRMLTDAYPGRFVLGIGVSHAGSVARRGSTYEKPYSAMRDYLDAMDRAPSSAAEPEVTPRLVLAALGPRMLELAAERAHGVHPTSSRSSTRRSRGSGSVRVRCSRGSRPVVLESDPSEARRVARGFALDYLQTENYARQPQACGVDRRRVAGQGSDALIDAVVAWGDVDRIAVRVRQHLDAGADHVCIQVVSEDELDPCLPQPRELAPALLEL
jgi:probable F420-dependent oxidoreductase, MSMEG_4141 family